MSESRFVQCGIICLLHLILGVHYSGATCLTVPISLSSLNSCQNNVCNFQQTANVVIPIGTGNQACIQYISPDGLTPASTLTITIDHAYFSRIASSAYLADDPATDLEGYCGCPGGSSPTCSSSYARVKYNDVVQCRLGYHKDGSCFLSGVFGYTGQWILRGGFSIKGRFKIIELSPSVTKAIGIVATSEDFNWAMDYTGVVATSTENPNFNITVVSDTSFSTFNPSYLVYDMQDTNDFWILTASEVNSINSFDTTKIGWAKYNTTVQLDPNLLNSLGVTVKNCRDNQLSYSTNWLSTAQYLQNHMQFLSSALSPDSVLIDTDFVPDTEGVKGNPQLNIEPYQYLQNGFIALGQSGDIVFFGLNEYGSIVPFPNGVGSIAGSSYCGQISSTPPNPLYALNGSVYYVNCTNITAFTFVVTHIVDPTSVHAYRDIVTWQMSSNSLINGFIIEDNNGNYDSVLNFTIGTQSWPSYKNATVTSVNGVITEYLTSNMITPVELDTPITNGALSLAITFNNLSITFTTTVIQPSIISLSFDSSSGLFTSHLKSQTVPGDCYISSDPPGIITTQLVTLAVVDMAYQFQIATGYINAEVCMTVQCYSNQKTSCVNAIYGAPETQDLISGNETEAFLVPPSWGLPSVSAPSGDWDWFTDIWNFGSWVDYIYAFISIVVFIIIAMILLCITPYLYTVIKWFYCKIAKIVCRKGNKQEQYVPLKKRQYNL